MANTLLDKIVALVERRQDTVARLADRMGVDYAPQRTQDFLGGVKQILATRKPAQFDHLKIVASAALLGDDYELLTHVLEYLDRVEGPKEVDADVVAAGIRVMAVDSLVGRMQAAVAAGDLPQAEQHLQRAYAFGLPAPEQLQPLLDAVRRRDPRRAAAIEQAYRAGLERASRSFDDRLNASRAKRELRGLVLPVFEDLVAAGQLDQAEQHLNRLYAADLSDFAPVGLLADAYLSRDPTPGSAPYRRAEALVARFLRDVGEPLGPMVALDAVRYQNAHFVTDRPG